MQRWIRYALVILSLLQCACATKRVIRDREYLPAVAAYQRGDPEAAYASLPRGEAGGFITSVEKGWLALWRKKTGDEKAMQAQVATFDERHYTSISREADFFLFQESEEGYVPSEHEIVLLHLLSAIQFSEKGQLEESKVELRRAGYVLDRYFDDAALRLWLGSLWASLGEWDEAQVDFRRAGILSGNHKWVRLADGPPPPELRVHFYGNGPLLDWKEGQFDPVFLPDPFTPLQCTDCVRTDRWFNRHSKRNTELREQLVKSNFMAQYLGSKALTQTERGLGKVATWGIRLTGVVVGVALVGGVVYLMAQSGASAGGEAISYLMAGAVAIGYGIWKHGRELDHQIESHLVAQDLRKQEDLRIYRMVRFLPTRVGLEISATNAAEGATIVRLKGSGVRTRVVLVNHY